MQEGQSRRSSFVEAWMNIFVGFAVNYTANLLIFPLFGFHISLEANFLMGLIYTVISLVRSYVIRRWFNGLMLRKSPPPELDDVVRRAAREGVSDE